MFILTCRFYAAGRDLLTKVNLILIHAMVIFGTKKWKALYFVGKVFVSGWGNRKISSN